MTGRDGREWVLDDPAAVVEAFARNGADLPVDCEHQSDSQPETRSGPVPAAGWIKELKADAAGLWGRVEWTAQARELIAGKAYRHLSPSVFDDQAGKAVIRLKGAGLVHKPNLHIKALAVEQHPAAGAQLGLPPGVPKKWTGLRPGPSSDRFSKPPRPVPQDGRPGQQDRRGWGAGGGPPCRPKPETPHGAPVQ